MGTCNEEPTARPTWSQGIDPARVSPAFLEVIPRDYARAHLVLSQGCTDEGVEQLLCAESTAPWILHNVGVALRTPITAAIFEGEAIARGIDAAYSARAPMLSSLPESGEDPSRVDVQALLQRADSDLLSTTGKAPVIRLLDALLFEALGKGASDLHVQPQAESALIRIRVDGILHEAHQLSSALAQQLVSRIKVLGRMDIAEKRLPQDGRTTVRIGARAIDLRISTLPTTYGERAVVRLLDHAAAMTSLSELGMPTSIESAYLRCAARSHGMVLVTGPTGSGKTTTLYATLGVIASPGVNIMTIEDPIEYELASLGLAVSQSQVNGRKGVTFATGLRHILRQDPDVIMVGEIRDLETARIAVQSSLTGHMVFSTLHTNDAVSALTRLLDLGIEPYLAAASLTAVLAQRLVRTLHRSCAGGGCAECLHSGFRGRTGLFELMVINESLRDHIATGAGLTALREAARNNGWCTLHEAGRSLVAAGRTRLEEVLRVVEEVPADAT